MLWILYTKQYCALSSGKKSMLNWDAHVCTASPTSIAYPACYTTNNSDVFVVEEIVIMHSVDPS